MGLARKNFQVFGVGHSLLPYWEGSGKGKAKRVTIPRLLRLGRGWQDHRPTNHLDYTFPPSPGFIPSRPIHVPVSVARMEEGNLSLCIGLSAVLLVFVLRQTRYLGFRLKSTVWREERSPINSINSSNCLFLDFSPTFCPQSLPRKAKHS